MRDAAAKGRMRGKKLTPAQVAEIKRVLNEGHTRRSIALKFGVSVTAIGQIARGGTWRSVEAADFATDASARIPLVAAAVA